jgi:hypothetical protein
MNPTFKILTATVMAGAASLALAQTPKESFAETFARMQAESSNSSHYQPTTPSSSSQAADPTTGLKERELQALSSESPGWQLDNRITVDHGPTFAQTHPHGIPFAEYQAESSNGGEFKQPGETATTSLAGADTGTTTGSAAKPTLRQRFASLFHRTTATQPPGN